MFDTYDDEINILISRAESVLVYIKTKTVALKIKNSETIFYTKKFKTLRNAFIFAKGEAEYYKLPVIRVF